MIPQIIQYYQMSEEYLKESINPQLNRRPIDFQNTRQSSQFNSEQQFSLLNKSLNQFEQQIKTLQKELDQLKEEPETKDVVVEQSHFLLKKNYGEKNNGGIYIEMEYLQDLVFKNLEEQHQEEISKIFTEAKSEINRLTDILRERDSEIMGLNEQITGLLNERQSYLKDQQKKECLDKDSIKEEQVSRHKLNYENIQKQNQDLIFKIQQLNNAIQHLNTLSKSTSPSSQPSLSSLTNQLNNKTLQCYNLNKTIATLSIEFQTLKNDNILFVEDIEQLKLKLEEQNSINYLQNEHIVALRSELGSKQQQMIQRQKINRQKSQNQSPKLSVQEEQSLRHQINILNFDNNSYKLNIQQLNNILKIQKSNNNKLREQLEHMQYYCNELKYQKQQLENQLNTTRSQSASPDLTQIKRQKEQLLFIIDKLKHQSSVKDIQNQRLKRDVRDITEQKRVSERKGNDLQNKVNMLQEVISKERDTIKHLKLENEDTKNINNSLIVDYQSSKDRIQKLMNEIGGKDYLNRQLENKLKQYQNSLYTFNLPNFNSAQQLINYSKSLFNQSPKPSNVPKMASLLNLTTRELQLALEQIHRLQSYAHSHSHSSNHPNLSFFQHQTNAYIETLLNNISQHQLQRQKIINQNYKLKQQIDFVRNTSNRQFTHGEVLNELYLQKVLTEKLSQRIKYVEIQLAELSLELGAKDQDIYSLQMQLNQMREMKGRDDYLDATGYYQHVNGSSRSPRVSEDVSNLRVELQTYKLELQKQMRLNQNMKQISRLNSLEYQQAQLTIQDLEKKLKQYQRVLGQYQRAFRSQQKQRQGQIQNKGRINLKTKINHLKDKSKQKDKPFFQSPVLKQKSKSIEKQKQLQRETERKKQREKSTENKKISTRTVHKRHTVLDHLIHTQKLSFQCILTLMLKIITEADNEKLFLSQSPILPQHIEILQYDKHHPQSLKVQIAESRQYSSLSKSPLYFAPQRLRKCEPTRKSLVWNLGIIFDLMINRKIFFKSENQILNNNVFYKFENKELPRLKDIIVGMLQKESYRRKTLAELKTMISSEIVALHNLRSQGS